MSRPFEAQYPGTCEECGERFDKGTTIRVVATGAAVHDVCPDDVPLPTSEICPRCFIEKSVTGACGCDL